MDIFGHKFIFAYIFIYYYKIKWNRLCAKIKKATTGHRHTNNQQPGEWTKFAKNQRLS